LFAAYHHWIAVDYEQKTRLYECLEAFESDMISPPPGEAPHADIPPEPLPLPPGEPPDADIPQDPVAPPPPRWQEEALENVCPCCFNFQELPSVFSVGI